MGSLIVRGFIANGQAGTETSLAENVIRTNMHPADQFDAFRSLVDKGIGVEEVAARFGVTPTTVRQRLKLAHVAPRLPMRHRQLLPAGDRVA
jgi:ParB family transcriptional regulator, chromosome partitioning protein